MESDPLVGIRFLLEVMKRPGVSGQPVNLKGNQSWMFIGRTDVKAETLILWLLYVKNWLIGKYPGAGKDWRQEEKGKTEDEMLGWHHWFYGHDFEQASGVGDGWGRLLCCSPWGLKESDTTERLNWTETIKSFERWKIPRYLFVDSVVMILRLKTQFLKES